MTPPPLRLIALGSSFAAGPGIAPVADPAARRSARNYPHLVAERLGAHLVDVTVTGATTATILERRQRIGRRRFAPQIEAVDVDADIVTVTAGGNDLDYLGGVIRTALLRRVWPRSGSLGIRQSRHRHQERAVDKAAAAADALVRIVTEIRRRAPGARVLLVDYVPIFTAETGADASTRFTSADIQGFRGVAKILSQVFRDAAERSGAELIPASAYSQDHGIGSVDPWVFGLRPIRDLGSSFHPTAAGMAAVAAVVVDRLMPRS